MFCQKCGKEIADNSVVCNYCGNPRQQQTFQPPQPFQPIVPPPAPKKKNNTLLIAIIATLITVVIVVAVIFIVNPLIEKNNSNSSSQSEIKDDDEDKADEKDDEKDGNKAKEEENALAKERNEATAALKENLNYLYNPDSEECILLLNGGPVAPDEEGAFEIVKSILYYFDYKITGCEKEDDSYIFTVDVDTLDFYPVIDEIKAWAEDVYSNPELLEKYTDDELMHMLFAEIAQLIKDGHADKTTVTVDFEMVCDENGEWFFADKESVLLTILNNYAAAFESISL